MPLRFVCCCCQWLQWVSCSYTFLVEKHTIRLVKFVVLGFVSYIAIFNSCHINVLWWCGSKKSVQRSRCTWSSYYLWRYSLWNNFVIVPGLVFILLVVRFKFCFTSKRELLENLYCGLENYFVWYKPFACKFVVLTACTLSASHSNELNFRSSYFLLCLCKF